MMNIVSVVNLDMMNVVSVVNLDMMNICVLDSCLHSGMVNFDELP